jgi:hypothetical protein
MFFEIFGSSSSTSSRVRSFMPRTPLLVPWRIFSCKVSAPRSPKQTITEPLGEYLTPSSLHNPAKPCDAETHISVFSVPGIVSHPL